MSVWDRLKSVLGAHDAAHIAAPLHPLLEALFEEDRARADEPLYNWKLEQYSAGKSLLAADREIQAEVVASALRPLLPLDRSFFQLQSSQEISARMATVLDAAWRPRELLVGTLRELLRKNLPLPPETVLGLVKWLGASPELSSYLYPISQILRTVDQLVGSQGLLPELRDALTQLRATLAAPRVDRDPDLRKTASHLDELLGTGPVVRIQPGEAWSDAALADLAIAEPTVRSRWHALLAHGQESGSAAPTGKWSKEARVRIDALGQAEFKGRMLVWLPLVDQPRTQAYERAYVRAPVGSHHIIEPHADLLKGLAWACGLQEDPELARALSALALSSYRKIPGLGPRLVKVGNACVHALGAMPGRDSLAQLALLKVRVKFGTAQKSIEKALTATAERAGLPRDEIEELAAPTYGLTGVGRCRETFGEFTADLVVQVDGGTELTWTKVDGKAQRSIPAAVKSEFPEELKELQTAARDIQKMLPAQRERIDSLFLQQKRWPVATWRERYLDHPLVGVIARRLLWNFTVSGQRVTGVFLQGQIVDLDLRPLPGLGDPSTTVELWHPIGRSLEEIVAWRDWFDSQEIQQPFKQAYREVYILTDAERTTGLYSNRFAAHVIRQHQFNALCAVRGWKNKLRLLVDDTYPPATRALPGWGLRAEFWIEGIGQNYGTDTNDSGVFLRLATDQVRFYRIDARQRTAHAGGGGYTPGWRQEDADPLPLDQVPPLVLSEIMRDVDLFVGVASVGNDPTWSDGGPEGRFHEYWQNYSFGNLSATAQTRKAVLERLVPRLKIADRCELTERFLVVRGHLRSYKIHLGSGNILMTPNDQYLCIVPSQSTTAKGGADVMLPFEGDNVLSIILSKAFLLAEDTKIKDPTIVSQINRRA